jgi:hypothetical protein
MAPTNAEIKAKLVAAEGFLKETTKGYKGHDAAWYANKTTNWYKGLTLIDEAIAALDPVTIISNMSGLGLNITTKTDTANIIIDGTGDSGVLFQKDAGGSTLRNCTMRRVAAGNSVTWAKHGVYGKAPNLYLENVDIDCSQYATSGMSMRFNGITVKGFSISGLHSHAITYYETSTIPGAVWFENGNCVFSADTGIWIDTEGSIGLPTEVIQTFMFKNIDMHGDGVFLKASVRCFKAKFTVDGCTLNGKPVTTADCPGVPNLLVM